MSFCILHFLGRFFNFGYWLIIAYTDDVQVGPVVITTVKCHLFMKSQWVRLLRDINDTVFMWLRFLNVLWLVRDFHRAYLCYLNDKNFHQDQILILLKLYSPNNNNTDNTRLLQCISVWLMRQYYFLQNQCKN